ncbi:neocarzinostatin apoprotein domain-containing protein [Streptomyces sp. H27-D2]|uniref:neocarzinostatin apoprotein domain-containing protein n=1 Tax=Streptomyces sp. H27-D2 TaxID=3046304 RepID=UPI002DB72E2B|nr:neocarzinostatin apoprotein domain-containing protein [Streptomyces sp. H27-D2]MEC4018780.1 neocarzinostatin apoprotein domain-containing protein [Streptomyces sp. H27-D2]
MLAALLIAPALVLLPAAPGAAADRPSVEVSKAEAGKGGTVTVSGEGWRPKTVLTLLICGQNMIGGTNSCANADGRAVTTGADGGFSRKLPVAEPPKPCPCVVHVTTATGETVSADAKFRVAGHPVAPLPKNPGGGRLAALSARIDGSSGLLTWFGAPPQRRLVVTVGNLGSAPVKNPVFQVGTAHGVFAPKWEEQQWRGTIPAGKRVRVELPVELTAGAHGDYQVSLKYDGRVLTEQPWGVGRPWGVTLFWILLCVVIPAAVFRIGMAVVDRPRPRSTARTRGARSTARAGRLVNEPRPSGDGKAGRHRSVQLPPWPWAFSRAERPYRRTEPEPPRGTPDDPAALPWFAPDTVPGPTTATADTAPGSAPASTPAPRVSAPSEPSDERPTSKGST